MCTLDAPFFYEILTSDARFKIGFILTFVARTRSDINSVHSLLLSSVYFNEVTFNKYKISAC